MQSKKNKLLSLLLFIQGDDSEESSDGENFTEKEAQKMISLYESQYIDSEQRKEKNLLKKRGRSGNKTDEPKLKKPANEVTKSVKQYLKVYKI